MSQLAIVEDKLEDPAVFKCNQTLFKTHKFLRIFEWLVHNQTGIFEVNEPRPSPLQVDSRAKKHADQSGNEQDLPDRELHTRDSHQCPIGLRMGSVSRDDSGMPE
ncbi:hypothetical protein [Singulisphaera sp. GP187]|uniref:hypothetical protein n=1 Tax=Singulisphaera sp. GP187 TaxID=1882752 RepID=UPI001160F728|nr:hypothetical protein [Singulisphaera sp. GP187]